MLEAIFWIAVGTFIGWNFPQPQWAKNIQKYATNKVKKITK